MSGKAMDLEYEDKILRAVEDAGESWVITSDDGWSLGIPKAAGVTPHVGSVARYYGEGIGRPVRGVDIDGAEVYYRTEDEQRAHDRAQVEAWNAEKRATAEDAKEETAKRIAALPEVMQRRVQKFRNTNPDFDWEFLPYELMVCADAVKIARAMEPRGDTPEGRVEELQAFYDLAWEQQKMVVPDLTDGHSGNSFGMACRLARWLLTDPEMAVKDHGALANLVGCEKYGCPRGSPGARPADQERSSHGR